MMLPLLQSEGGTEFDPVAEFTDFLDNPYVSLPLGLDINKGVVYLWLSAALAVGLTLFVVRRGLKVRPDRRQTTMELIYEAAQEQIAGQGLPPEGMRLWFPYVAALFVFVWAMNIIGFIPLPFGTDHKFSVGGLEIPEFQIYAATANLMVTLALALVTIIASHVEGIRYNGVVPYFKSWIPAGTPKAALPLIAVIEVISQFVRIISLSVRLFANLLAGHLVIAVFLGLAGLIGGAVGYFLLPIGVAAATAIYTLEVTLIALLQAYIFATLSAIYIGGAIRPEH
jgi:F-type H+-transporting ATPase subunit a